MDSRDRGRALGHRKTIWIKRNPKEHIVPWGYIFPIRLQARVPGYSRRPSVTKSRVRLQTPPAATVPPSQIVSISASFSTVKASCINGYRGFHRFFFLENLTSVLTLHFYQKYCHLHPTKVHNKKYLRILFSCRKRKNRVVRNLICTTLNLLSVVFTNLDDL